MTLAEALQIKQKDSIATFRRSGKKFIIYGAGNVGKDLLDIFSRHKLPVKYFIDINAKNDQHIKNIPVITPEKAKSLKKEDVCVVIGLFNSLINAADIKKTLKGYGYKVIYNFFEIFHIFADELGSRYFMQKKDYYRKNSAAILKAADIWADEKSWKLYRQTLLFRITGDLKYSPEPDQTGAQYFPEDVPGWKNPYNFIDCGAFNGDTMLNMKKRVGRIKKIAAFEPDSFNINKLMNMIRENDPAEEVYLFPCGVYSKTTQIRFSANKGSSCCIDPDGTTFIQTAAIDDALINFKPDLIKMDIEGSEIDALNGAAQTIKRSSCNLAVCVYHKPDDIWRIVELINNWNLNFKMYLRVHYYHSFEMVLYAVR